LELWNGWVIVILVEHHNTEDMGFKGKLFLGGFNFIRVKYLGENNVLFFNDGAETVKNMVEENKK